MIRQTVRRFLFGVTPNKYKPITASQPVASPMIPVNRAYLDICDFDHDIYKRYDDLSKMTPEELENHFFNFGINEGRFYNKIQSRKDFLDSIKINGKMLEIGPLDSPQLNHNLPDYYSVDVFTKEELIRNYGHDPAVNKEKIIEPSYVISDNDYSQIKDKFNCIFSCHSIEHIPCVVTFLNNLAELLTPDGYIYLVIPDKRYCFDHFKKDTDIYDVLQSYYEKSYRPRFVDVLRFVTQLTHNNCVDHWDNKHGEVDTKGLVAHYPALLDMYQNRSYMDAHVSYFTPENFMKIVETLNEMKLVNVQIHKLYHTFRNNLEFYVILKKKQTY